jgi:hypothetical protein
MEERLITSTARSYRSINHDDDDTRDLVRFSLCHPRYLDGIGYDTEAKASPGCKLSHDGQSLVDAAVA